MQRDITHFVRNVCSCLKQRRPTVQTFAPLKNIVTYAPLELISMDFLHLEKNTSGHEYVLVIVDHFTRFAQAYPTKNKEARTAADKLYNDFILNYGFPTRILHDQGREFENKLFNQLEKLCGIYVHEQRRTTRKGMAKRRGSIRHSCPCCVLYQKTKNVDGINTYPN